MQKRSKVLLALAVALIMVFALATTALADDYSSHWSSSFVRDAVAKGWITTDANGNVQPDALTTRGAYALMMWKSLGSPTPIKANPFTDVPETAPYYNAVRSLYEAGITTGMTATTFGPDVNLNREMACTMLVRAHKLSPINANTYQQFADNAQISDWARSAISAMLEGKYIEGIGNNMFAPKQNLKNGEMIKIVMGVANGTSAAAAIAQQQAAAALTAVLQQQNSSTLTLKLSLRFVSSKEAYVIVEADDTSGSIDYTGYRLQESGDSSYTSKEGFSTFSDDEFKVTADGTYVVCATNKKGGFIAKTINVKGLNKSATIPVLTPKYNSDDTEVTITVTGVDEDDIIGYTSSTNEPTTAYTSSSKFSGKVDNDGKFTVTTNGWYAVGVETSRNVFSFAVIEIDDIDKANSYTVTFNSNGGSSVSSQTIASGKKVSEPSSPTRSGYTFDGWYADSALSDKWSFNNDTISKNTTLYAKWTAGQTQTSYTVTFDTDGGSIAPVAQTVANGGKVTAVTNPTKANFTFDGWYNGTTKWEFATSTVSGNITLKAKWTATQTQTTYTVTVTSGSGSGPYASGVTVTISANNAPSGQVFDKWTTSDGVIFANANSASTSFTMPAKAVTVTATYKAAPSTTYTVNVNSGSGGGSYASGATVNITAGTAPSGKVFDKWETSSSGVTFANANNESTSFTMPANAVTVTATYKDAPTPTTTCNEPTTTGTCGTEYSTATCPNADDHATTCGKPLNDSSNCSELSSTNDPCDNPDHAI